MSTAVRDIVRRAVMAAAATGVILPAMDGRAQSAGSTAASRPAWAQRTTVSLMPLSSDEMVSLGGGISCPPPRYPAAARRTMPEGTTVLRMKVDADGHVLDREVVQSSGASPEHRLLDIALDQAYRTCTFPPAAEAGVREFTLTYAWDAQVATAPKALSCPRPDYPPAALRSGATGTSRVKVTIAPDGSVSEGHLIGASGPTREHALLDSQALASFRQCRFPAEPGRPPRQTTLDYIWRLQ